MPLFLGVHRSMPAGVTAEDVAEAHTTRPGGAPARGGGVTFTNFWYSEESGVAHCLAEGPDADAVRATHQAARGMVPDELRRVIEE